MGVIGDVCGKGVGAALFMTLFRSLIRAAATTDIFCGEESGRAPTTAERLSRIVSFTNTYIVETHADTNMFATVFIGIFDRQRGQLTYANCGNEPPLLAHDGGQVSGLWPTGPVLGIIADAQFHVRELPMETNDLLLVFTDGIPDALNAEGQSFGKERLSRILGDNHLSPSALLQQIEVELGEHIGTARQFDDITLLAVQRSA
jgi:serine phosphatase RsbU (regulator of sigma subunit)